MKIKAGRVVNENRDAFEIVIDNEHRYGVVVEVYDVRYPHTEFGQLASFYGVETFMEPCPGGLDLHGGVDGWELDGPAMEHAQRLVSFALTA